MASSLKFLFNYIKENHHWPHFFFVLIIATVFALGLFFLGAAKAAEDLYVSPNGNDSNPGTLAQPFRTIQRCADTILAGYTCYIRSGTYRETVVPVNSGQPGLPITFRPYPGEVATISGADIVNGWSVHSGSIYKTSGMNWDLGQGKNQLFVDGQMMTEARWPNTGTDPSNPTWAIANGGGVRFKSFFWFSN